MAVNLLRPVAWDGDRGGARALTRGWLWPHEQLAAALRAPRRPTPAGRHNGWHARHVAALARRNPPLVPAGPSGGGPGWLPRAPCWPLECSDRPASLSVPDSVYIESNQKDQPYFICTIQDFRRVSPPPVP